MKSNSIIFCLLLAMLISACTDEYECKCIDNSFLEVTQGNISGVNIIPANVVASSSESFKIVVDNSAKTWDGITIRLFDNDNTYLDVANGVDFMSIENSTVVLNIPISSITQNDEPVLGELKYTCNFVLGDNSVQLSGSIGVITCDGFYDDFDPIDCRWSCQLNYSGYEPGHCTPECPI